MTRPDLVAFVWFVLLVLGLWFAAWAALGLVEQRRARRLEQAQLEPCPRCGKPVAVGSEEYHRRRCTGKPKEQKNLAWKGGGRIER